MTPCEAGSVVSTSGDYSVFGAREMHWIVLGFVEGWLCRGGCRGGGGGVVAMVAVLGGGG